MPAGMHSSKEVMSGDVQATCLSEILYQQNFTDEENRIVPGYGLKV